MAITLQLLAVLVLFGATANDAKKILILPYWNTSHFLEMDGIGRPLVERGHDVYVMLDEEIQMPKNSPYKLITYRNRLPIAAHFEETNVHKAVESSKAGTNLTFLMNVIKAICTNMASDPETIPKLKSLKFDIALVDNLNIPCFYIVPYKLGIPYVTVGTIFPGFVTRLPLLPSVFQPSLGLELWGINACEETPQQSSFVRGLCRMTSMIMLELIRSKTESDYIRQYIDFPSMAEVLENTALHLVNSNHLLSNPIPKLPNVEFVGGLTTKPAKPLVADLEKWMSDAANVVLVSFGSNIGSLPPSVRDRIFSAFSQLHQYRFLFRFSVENSKTNYKVPQNVRLMDWLPQNDVLGHKSTRLFITHSGNNGQQEALYHGVPMLCFYIQIDQRANAMRVTKKGFGKMIDIHDFTTAQLIADVTELIENTTYSDRIKKASAIFHSEKHPTLRAVDAIEQILNFGTDHLRLKEAYELTWWQFYMLDVLAVLFVVALLIAVLLYKFTKLVVQKLLGFGQKKAKSD